MFSSTVSQGIRPNFWNTMAIRFVRICLSCAAEQWAISTEPPSCSIRIRPPADGVQPIDAPQKARFAGPGKAHQHTDLALFDRQIGFLDTDGQPRLLVDGIPRQPLIQQFERGQRIR